jgi:hypothetical protein
MINYPLTMLIIKKRNKTDTMKYTNAAGLLNDKKNALNFKI